MLEKSWKKVKSFFRSTESETQKKETFDDLQKYPGQTFKVFWGSKKFDSFLSWIDFLLRMNDYICLIKDRLCW